MLKFWLYVLVLVILCIIGLTIGSANDTVVDFDFLFVKAEVSLAVIFTVGVAAGVILGLYVAFLFCFRSWIRTRSARAEARQLKQEIALLRSRLPETKQD